MNELRKQQRKFKWMMYHALRTVECFQDWRALSSSKGTSSMGNLLDLALKTVMDKSIPQSKTTNTVASRNDASSLNTGDEK